jgi:hypothetical protein
MALLDDLVAKVTDAYERKARLYPALLALLPLIVTFTLLNSTNASSLSRAVSIAASCGGLFLMTNVCRELGGRLEVKLYREWGGKPTTQLLRHRDKRIEGATKKRYHAFLAARINEPFPDKQQEEQNPDNADEIYQSGVRWLLSHTRPNGNKDFDLIFNENVAYGFRRNALGIKPFGLIASFGSTCWILAHEGVLAGTTQYFFDPAAFRQMPEAAIVSLAVSISLIFIWTFFLTKACTRSAAFTYAEMLLRACDSI